MFKSLKAILFFSLLCQPIFANVGDLEIKLLNGGKKELNAGSNINVLIMLTNRSSTDKELQIRLSNKGYGWKLISDYSSIRIDKTSSTNKILGIQIPNNWDAGDFTIELEALEKPAMQSFGLLKIPITILPRYEIDVSKLKAPHYLFAGDTVSAFYLIQNLSNLAISVKATIAQGTQIKTNYLDIPKDSSVVYSSVVNISKSIDTYTQQSIVLTASIKDKPETEKTVYSSFDVFPVGNSKFDKYNRFPVKISGVVASSNRFGKQVYSEMYDIRGIGMLGKKNDKKLDIHLRGPDRSGNPLFGMNEEYYLKYTSPNLVVSIGDNNFGLSELTESSRNALGVEVMYKIKKLSIGSYYNHPKYYPLIKEIYSAYTSYTINPKNILAAGFLNKTDTAKNASQLMTVSAVLSPYEWISTNTEVAFGQSKAKVTKAYRTALHLRYSVFSLNGSYTFAEPDFPGYFSNSLRMHVGGSVSLKKFNVSLNYGINSSNMALDTLYANAPFSENLSFTTGFRITPFNTLTLGGFKMTIKDKSPVPLFNYSKSNGQIGIQNKFGRLGLKVQGELGKMENKLASKSEGLTVFYNGNASLLYSVSRTLSTSLFATYQGGQQMVTGFDQFYYGGSLMANLKERFQISVQYNSNYEWRYYTSDRSLFSLNMNGRINDRNELGISANYNLMKNTLNTKEYNLQLKYNHTLNVPISKKKNVGSLTGKILNHGVDKVSGIRVNLNGIVTITDKDGNFKFPTIPIGTYMLGVDASSFGLNAVPEIAGQNLITIEPSVVTRYEFAMTKSARVIGQLVVQEDEKAGQKGYIPVKEQIEKLIIEASNGTETFRILTDRDGNFVFEDLRPGSWQIKIYPKGLPQGYSLVTGQYNLNLVSGKSEKLEVLIKKQARVIIFQKTTIK